MREEEKYDIYIVHVCGVCLTDNFGILFDAVKEISVGSASYSQLYFLHVQKTVLQPFL